MIRTQSLRWSTAALAAVLAAGAAACTDVTTEPRSAISSGNVFADPGAYQAAVAKLYGTLALSGPDGPGNADIQGIDAGFGQYLRALWVLQQLPTDETTLAWNDQSAGVQELNVQEPTPGNGSITAMFARILLQARLASNFLVETTDDRLTSRGVTTTQRAEIRRFRAEARFLRALSYWHGLDLFGQMPLITESSAIGATPSAATRQQLYDFVVSELQAVRADLPAPNRADPTQYGRASQAAVDMLLAHVYLNAQVYTNTARYDSVVTTTSRVIASNAFQLDARYQNLFLADNNTSPELIFAVPFDGARTRSYGGTTFLAHAQFGDDLPDVRVGRDLGLNGGWYGLRARPALLNLFNTLTTDQRGGIRSGVQAILNTTGQTLSFTRQVDNYNEGVRVHKYRNVTKTGAQGADLEFVDIDFPMFRLADAYLMYAEAAARSAPGANVGTAVGYVNALRTRAGASTIVASDLTPRFVLDERARELFWEGHRRTDLIRYGLFTGGGYLWQFKGGSANGTATPETRNLYPIPLVDIAANPTLRQNPGY
jgi:hypothetical protein